MKIKGVKKGLKGTLVLPGDKSISHRAVILGALAEGSTQIKGFLQGEDCLNTLKNFSRMGVKYTQKGNDVVIEGVGLKGLAKPNKALDVGNSGTAFRLMTGVLSGQSFITKLTGDASIQKRPMKRVIDPLKKMGGRFSGEAAPLIVFPGKIHGITYELAVPSAQVKSAVLLAGLYADQTTTIIESAPTRDHTERMLKAFGLELKIQPGAKKGSQKIILPASKERKLKGITVTVPTDISSAAFFIVAALIVPNSKLVLKNVGVNPTRTGLLDVLIEMGAQIKLKNKKIVSGEPIADIEVESSSLKAISVTGDTVVRMIDEIPIFAVAAACAEGVTTISSAEELRVKESDRIKAIHDLLKAFGISSTEKPDGLVITGKPKFSADKIIRINSHYDHRIAMSGLILGLLNKKETTVSDDKCIETSFPGFLEYLTKVI
jgi:3-phosphoshikimate 1-carboxyvinyltransferase